MLYKTAAYVYLVALTITLLFTTSQAEFEIKKARDIVRTLFNKFIHITLKKQSQNLEGLITTANDIMKNSKFENYLCKVASSGGRFSDSMAQFITGYENEFRDLLNGINYKEEEHDKQRIPMFEIINNLRMGCSFNKGTSSQMEYSTDVKASTTLLDQLILSSEEADQGTSSTRFTEEHEAPMPRAEENVTDNFGFKINTGKKNVKFLLDKFLELALEKSCDSLETLTVFADEMINETVLYQAVSDVAHIPRSDLQRYINDYMDNFLQMLGNAENDGAPIPIKDQLNVLLNKCRDYSEPPRRNLFMKVLKKAFNN